MLLYYVVVRSHFAYSSIVSEWVLHYFVFFFFFFPMSVYFVA